MASEFLIQVTHRATGKVVEWAPGQPVEKQFVTELVDRVRAKGVGIFRSSDHVAADVEAALKELLTDLKALVPPR